MQWRYYVNPTLKDVVDTAREYVRIRMISDVLLWSKKDVDDIARVNKAWKWSSYYHKVEMGFDLDVPKLPHPIERRQVYTNLYILIRLIF